VILVKLSTDFNLGDEHRKRTSEACEEKEQERRVKVTEVKEFVRVAVECAERMK
jgi:hypothetical protein